MRRRPSRWRTKATRRLAEAIERAGGTVVLTAGGHLRVTGPEGVAVVSSKLDTARGRKNAIRDLRRHAGIDLRDGAA